jgi:hypothetical protein
MIEFFEFQVERKSDYAVLVLLNYDENVPAKKLWFPLSKIEIMDKVFKVNKEFWEDKLNEIIKDDLENNKLVNVPCQKYEEFEKSIKIVFKMKLKDREIVVWGWLPLSLISNIDEEENDVNKFNVTVPNWCWKKSLQKAIEKQLDFYNRENSIYNYDDFSLLYPVD